jgi:hypothetical protein
MPVWLLPLFHDAQPEDVPWRAPSLTPPGVLYTSDWWICQELTWCCANRLDVSVMHYPIPDAGHRPVREANKAGCVRLIATVKNIR